MTIYIYYIIGGMCHRSCDHADLLDIWCSAVLWKSFEKFQIWSQSSKNIWHVTWRP